MPLSIYVGYAIDQAGESVSQVEDRIKKALATMDEPILAYFPRAPFFVHQKDMLGAKWNFIRKINEAAIAASDCCIFLSKGGFSFGMPLEVDLASQHGIPWMFVDESGKEAGGYLVDLQSRGSTNLITSELSALSGWLERVVLHNKPKEQY